MFFNKMFEKLSRCDVYQKDEQCPCSRCKKSRPADVKRTYQSRKKCPKCGLNNNTWHGEQRRSADEPETIVYTCMEETCGNVWCYN